MHPEIFSIYVQYCTMLPYGNICRKITNICSRKYARINFVNLPNILIYS